jgi:hypothetical protein
MVRVKWGPDDPAEWLRRVSAFDEGESHVIDPDSLRKSVDSSRVAGRDRPVARPDAPRSSES